MFGYGLNTIMPVRRGEFIRAEYFKGEYRLMFDDNLRMKFQSVYGVLQSIGTSTTLLRPIVLIGPGLAAYGVCWVWANPVPDALKAAFLCCASVLASLYALPLDFCILTIAVAYFVSDGLTRGFLPGERLSILICWLGLFLLTIAPTGPFICLVLAVVVLGKIVAFEKTSPTPAEAAEGGGICDPAKKVPL